MNTLFRRSASFAPAASRQTLAVLQLAAPTRSSGFRACSSSTKKGTYVIDELKIDWRIVIYLHNIGITKLFPVQRSCFEPVMQGCDVVCWAKTGAGKTLAFGIPIMDKILKNWETNGRKGNPIAVVLTPNGALARRDELVFRETAPLDTLIAYGGMPIESQMRRLKLGVDALFGTPGRIIDLTKKGALHLKDVQFVVLDEADQLLDVGFEITEAFLKKVPANSQITVFSSTKSQLIENFKRKYLKEPVTIDIGEEQLTGQMGGGGGGNISPNTIYVGRLPQTLTEEEFKQHFQQFGNVTNVLVKRNKNTNRMDCGLIFFDNEDAVHQALYESFHKLKGDFVEVRRPCLSDVYSIPGSGGRSGGSQSPNAATGYGNQGSGSGYGGWRIW